MQQPETRLLVLASIYDKSQILQYYLLTFTLLPTLSAILVNVNDAYISLTKTGERINSVRQ